MFIELTPVMGGELLVRAEAISAVMRKRGTDVTDVFTVDPKPYRVTETLAQIDMLIQDITEAMNNV